jgi:hypothetical protein
VLTVINERNLNVKNHEDDNSSKQENKVGECKEEISGCIHL